MKKRRKNEAKGNWGFLVAGLLSLMAGVALAAAQLAFRPVADRPFSQGEDPREVVCLRGGMAGEKGWDERAKKVWHAVPGHYVFSEGDLNSLVEKHLNPVVAIDGIETVHVEELPNVHLLENGQVQVSTVITMPAYAGSHRFVYQVRGRVVPGGFQPEMGWFGQCPVPLFNMSVLQMIRRQMVVDKDVTGLAQLRKKVHFSRAADTVVVDVLP